MSATRSPGSVRKLSFIAVGVFAVWGLLSPTTMTTAASGVVGFMLDAVGWLYLLICSSFLVLAAFLAFGPYGRVRLGPDDSRPDFSTLSWISMLFAGGMGAGLVFWGVAEPVSHFAQPPGAAAPASPEAARLAMVLTALHWGSIPGPSTRPAPSSWPTSSFAEGCRVSSPPPYGRRCPAPPSRGASASPRT